MSRPTTKTINELVAEGAKLSIYTWRGAWRVTRYSEVEYRCYATHPITGEEMWFSTSEYEVLRENGFASGDAPRYAFGETI